jgi:hypothetical protein
MLDSCAHLTQQDCQNGPNLSCSWDEDHLFCKSSDSNCDDFSNSLDICGTIPLCSVFNGSFISLFLTSFNFFFMFIYRCVSRKCTDTLGCINDPGCVVEVNSCVLSNCAQYSENNCGGQDDFDCSWDPLNEYCRDYVDEMCVEYNNVEDCMSQTNCAYVDGFY